MAEGAVFLRAARSHEARGLGCEDAAICALEGARGFAALCDGCSSGEDSGLAAMALSRAAAHAWRQGAAFGEDLARRAWEGAAGALRSVGLDPEASPATLLMCELDEEAGVARLALWGDGVVARVDSRDGSLRGAWVGQSALNMPAYPCYAMDEGMWGRFAAAGGEPASWEPLLGGGGIELARSARFWSGSAALEEGDMFLLLSDGACSVEGVPLESALAALAGARGPGSFMTRRAGRAVEGWLKSGASLGDDFGVAALRLSRGARA